MTQGGVRRRRHRRAAAPPAYFSFDAVRNREVHALLDETVGPAAADARRGAPAAAVGRRRARHPRPHEFAVGHLAGSINVGLDGRYAEYAGGVVQPGAPIVLVTEDGHGGRGEEPPRPHRLRPRRRAPRRAAARVRGAPGRGRAQLADRRPRARAAAGRPATTSSSIDVRQPGETAAGTIDGADRDPADPAQRAPAGLDAASPTVVYCAGGYRSSIAASRMAAAGFTDVADLLGGYGAWAARRARDRP